MVVSSRYDSIIGDYRTELKKLAADWEWQNGRWSDSKSKEFAVRVIEPVSICGKSILRQSDELRRVLVELLREEIVSEI